MNISEIKIIPIKPDAKGLVAFASCLVDWKIYLSSIGILTKLSGGYRICYPSKKIAGQNLHYFHPINQETTTDIEKLIIKKYEEITKKAIG